MKFIQIVRLIAAHSLSIARYSPPPQSLPFINATTKVCYFPLIFFFKIFLAYLCIKYMIVGHHETFLSKKGFTIGSMNLSQNYWKKMELFNQILLAFSLNIVATKDWAHMLLIQSTSKEWFISYWWICQISAKFSQSLNQFCFRPLCITFYTSK